MSYEAMPCVLKNEDGTPMYGLLIKPLQNQVVIQLASNQQQQQQQQQSQQPQQQQSIVPSLCSQSSNGNGVSMLAVQSQMPSTSSWNGNARTTGTNGTTGATPTRRHYPTILPRETAPSSSKSQQVMPWGSPPSTSGAYPSCSGGSNNNGFAALVNSKQATNVNAVKFAYAASMPSLSPLPTPALLPFFNGTGQQTPAAFTQALSAYGLVSSQPIGDANGSNSQQEQQFDIYDQSDGGMQGTSTSMIRNDCISNASAQINFAAAVGCASADLDSLLRDIDLTEITNSLMPLLQDCGAENGEALTADGNNRSTSAILFDEKAPVRLVQSADPMASFEGQVVDTSRSQSVSVASSSRPPCRYQGLLSNTSNLRVGSSIGQNAPPTGFSVFETNVGPSEESTVAAESTNEEQTDNAAPAEKEASALHQVVVAQSQTGSSDYEHASATTPDSGIQSIGDSPHAVPQSSPMQFFSASPDGRRRRLSANGTACNSTAVPQVELPQSQIQPQPQLPNYQEVQSGLNSQIGDTATSGTWTQNYMHPLSVNTTYFEPISECESSPTVRVPGSPAGASHFPALTGSRCYSPSTTSSECGNEPLHRRPPIGSAGTKRRRRTKKRGSAGAGGMSDLTDMPILQPEAPRQPGDKGDASFQVQHEKQSKHSDNSKEKEQLTLNVNDPNALVEKLLAVVPKEQLASLRRILDERLNGSNQANGASTLVAGNAGGFSQSRTSSKASVRDTSVMERTLSRWQSRSKNAGYASDTSDVSSMADIIGSHAGGKKATEEEGDSAASSSIRWLGDGQASQSLDARRSSVSSSCALSGEAKKQDSLKRLMEYRAKARSNCVIPSASTRVNEIIPSIIQLHIKDGDDERSSAHDSLTKAFKQVSDRLRILKEKWAAEQEKNSLGESDKQRLATFNNLQNLETEASDDEEDDNDVEKEEEEVPSPEFAPEVVPSVALEPARDSAGKSSNETTGNLIDDGNCDSADSRPTEKIQDGLQANDITTAKQQDITQELVQVKENPQRKNISVKIKLSLLRGTSSETAATRTGMNSRSASKEKEREKQMDSSSAGVEELMSSMGKGKRSKTQTILPPKKRFKDGEVTTEPAAAKETSRTKEDGKSRKRHRELTPGDAGDGAKKQKLAMLPVVLVEPLAVGKPNSGSSVSNSKSERQRHGAAKNKGTKNTTSLFRRCRICVNWLRVEDIDGSESDGSLCSDCRSKRRRSEEPLATLLKPATSVKSKTKESRREERKKSDKKSSKAKESFVESSTPAKRSVRAGKAAQGVRWKPPRKTFLKAGIFSVGDGSSDVPLTPPTLVPSQCRLLGEGAEGGEFQLPYDFWYYLRYQSGLLSDDPSRNYRKLRSNIYIDPKPNSPVNHHVCSCKLPIDRSVKACGDECLNRLMYTECSASSCPCGDRCTNNRFQKREWVDGLQIFDSGTNKGKGVKAKEQIKEGTFICEYVGEVVTRKTFGERMATWYKNYTHHYALNLDAGLIIDGYRSGSIARFINHSCEPNCEIQKWWVNGHYRIGVFALRDIKPGEELSYNYKFHAFNTPQACLCGTASCGGFVDRNLRGERANHQARKSKPKRANAREDQSDSVSNKSHLVKPMSHRERVTVVKGRLFLLRNVDGLRKKLQTLHAASSETVAAVDDEKRKAEIISSQLTALKTSRSMRTRRSAVSEDDAQIQKLTGLVQLLNSVLRTLKEAVGKDNKALLARFKKAAGRSKKTTSGAPQPPYLMEFHAIEQNVEKGLYKTPEEFDRDIKSLFKSLKTGVNGEQLSAKKIQAVEELELVYESAKEEISDQLKDALGFQLPADFLRKHTEAEKKNRGGAIATPDKNSIDDLNDLYWDTDAPFQVNYELEESSYTALWHQKADEYDDDDEYDKVRCICGFGEDEGEMVQCDGCLYWQHNECVGVKEEVPEFFCEFCVSGKQVIFRDVILTPQPEIRLVQCVYYKALVKNGLQIRVGETVYVKRCIDEKHKQVLRNFNEQCVQAVNGISKKKTTEPEPEPEREPVVEPADAQADQETSEQIFFRRSELRVFRVERLFIAPNNVKFVFGQYYARPHETFCEATRRFFKKEVFVTPLYDTLPLDAVVGRCLVLDGKTYKEGRPKYPKFDEEDVYVSEFKLNKAQHLFDGHKARLTPLPICTRPYIFETFAEPLEIKRDFTPFIEALVQRGWISKAEKSKLISGKSSEIMDKKRLLMKTKQKRVEKLIEKVKRMGKGIVVGGH